MPRVTASVNVLGMMKRIILTMLVVLTGLAVTISPVVAQAASGQVGCGIIEIVADHSHASKGHVAHANHGTSGHVRTANDNNSCCDMVCSVDFPLQVVERQTAFFDTCLPHAWDCAPPVDQSGPFGLKRPPRV